MDINYVTNKLRSAKATTNIKREIEEAKRMATAETESSKIKDLVEKTLNLLFSKMEQTTKPSSITQAKELSQAPREFEVMDVPWRQDEDIEKAACTEVHKILTEASEQTQWYPYIETKTAWDKTSYDVLVIKYGVPHPD